MAIARVMRRSFINYFDEMGMYLVTISRRALRRLQKLYRKEIMT